MLLLLCSGITTRLLKSIQLVRILAPTDDHNLVVTASPVPVDGPVQVLAAAAVELLGVVPDPQQDGHGLVATRGQVSLAPKQPGPGLAASKRAKYLQLTPRFSSQIHDLAKIFSGIKTIG